MADIDIGTDFVILANVALTDAYVSITTTRPFVSALMQEKDLKNVTIRKSSTLTDEFNTNGSPIKITAKMIPASGVTNTILQAKMSNTGETGTLQIILNLI